MVRYVAPLESSAKRNALPFLVLAMNLVAVVLSELMACQVVVVMGSANGVSINAI